MNPDRNSRNQDRKGGNPDHKGSNPDHKGSNPDHESRSQDRKGRNPDHKGSNPDQKSSNPDLKSDNQYHKCRNLVAIVGSSVSCIVTLVQSCIGFCIWRGLVPGTVLYQVFIEYSVRSGIWLGSVPCSFWPAMEDSSMSSDYSYSSDDCSGSDYSSDSYSSTEPPGSIASTSSTSSTSSSSHSADSPQCTDCNLDDAWEMCCSAHSSLTKAARRHNLQARRITLATGWDLSKRSSVERGLQAVCHRKPRVVWCSPECKPWSAIQNLNNKIPGRAKRLQQMRKASICLVQNCVDILEAVVAQDGDIYFEWPRRCHGWRIRPLQHLRRYCEKVGKPTWSIPIDGCQYGLKSVDGKTYLQKPWTILTTDESFKAIGKKCPGERPGHRHSLVQGKDTRRSAFYPKAMAEAIALHWRRRLA